MTHMIRSKAPAPGPISLAVLAVLATLALLPVGRAFAQDQAVIDKLVQMNKKALEDYDTLEWDSAKRTLLDALMTGKKAGLDTHPVMARTYVHLGAVYITGFKNREKAIQSFVRAFEIDPGIQLSKGIATSEVNDAFAEAQRKAKKGSGAGGGGDSGDNAAPPPSRKRRGPTMEADGEGTPSSEARPRRRRSDDDESGEPDLPIRITALDCPEPDEAILEKSVTLRCAVSPKLSVSSVVLHYRATGKEDYDDVDMKKTPKGWFQGKIPKKAVVGKSLQYYYEGLNAAGKPVVANGDKNAPNIMLIVEEEQKGKTAGTDTGTDEDENPLNVDEGPKKKKVFLGRRDTTEEGLDLRYGKRKYWIGLGFGSGYGYAKGNGLEAVNLSTDPDFNGLKNYFQPGLAWAGVAHLAPEFGYMISPDFAVSIAGRFQYIPQPDKYAKYAATGALSGLAKAIVYTKQNQVRFFAAGMLGGGEGVRFTVFPGVGTKFADFKDTVRMGPVLAGVGGGVYYEASKPVSIVLEVDGLAGFPQIGFVGDLNLAFQVNLY